MMRKMRQASALVLASAMVIGASASAMAEQSDGFTYPMEDTTLTINYTSDGSNLYDNSSAPEWCKDILFMENLKKATGVTLEDVGGSPAAQQTSEEFLLMLASGEYPDIMYINWLIYPGGPEAAFDEDYIIDLRDVSEYMPNLTKYLEENPDIEKMITTEDGKIYAAPYIKQEEQLVQTGLVVRQDWLDQVGMEVPKTYQEMHDVLEAFKNECGANAPLTFENRWLFLEYAASSISSAWNTAYPFYIDDEDKVQFGPLTENYKEFITEMAKWYSEGLIDVDVASVDKATVQAKFSNGEAGIAVQQIGNVENCQAANEGTDYAVTGMHSLAESDDAEPQFSQYTAMYDGGFGFGISTQCKNVEAAARWLDYFYSEEGSMLINYGIEGVTYEMVDGKPQFTDLIMNNEETPNPTSARSYVAQYRNWPHVTVDANVQYPETSKEILSAWRANMGEHAYPTLILSEDEQSVVTEYWNDIDTYCREMITKFMIGTEDLSNWDSFIDTIKSMGIEEVLAARQSAYERYASR